MKSYVKMILVSNYLYEDLEQVKLTYGTEKKNQNIGWEGAMRGDVNISFIFS